MRRDYRGRYANLWHGARGRKTDRDIAADASGCCSSRVCSMPDADDRSRMASSSTVDAYCARVASGKLTSRSRGAAAPRDAESVLRRYRTRVPGACRCLLPVARRSSLFLGGRYTTPRRARQISWVARPDVNRTIRRSRSVAFPPRETLNIGVVEHALRGFVVNLL